MLRVLLLALPLLSLLSLLPLLAGAACLPSPSVDAGPGDGDGDGDDGGSPGDGDGDEPGDGDGDGDGDIPPDPSLDGTPLAGLDVRFDAPLELCTAWTEGLPLEEELGRKARVVIPPNPRYSLGEVHLGLAEVEGVLVERGPFSADRERFAGGAASNLIAWELTVEGASTRLHAEIAHDLGPWGTLVESLDVLAGSAPPSPIDYADEWGPVRWSLVDGPDTLFLEPCRPALDDPSFEAAVEVSVASGGGRDAVVTRYSYTALAVAGSAPVRLFAHDIRFSTDPWVADEVSGYWPQTYAALHHNWSETVDLDFRRDLAHHHRTFGPIARGELTAGVFLEHAVLDKLAAGLETPELHLTWLDAATGSSSEELLAATPLVRVDETALLRQAQLQCDDAAVLPIASPSFSGPPTYFFQALVCENDSPLGFSLLGLMPVAFEADFHQVGQLADEVTHPDPEDPVTVHVAVGQHTVELRQSENSTSLIVAVLDGAGTSLKQFLVTPEALWPPALDDRLVGSDATGGVHLDLVRRWAGQGAGSSSIYVPVAMALTFDGETHLVDGYDQLRYYNTHHNWNDALVATEGDLELTWTASYVPDEVIHTVEASRGGVPILAPTVIVLDEGAP